MITKPFTTLYYVLYGYDTYLVCSIPSEIVYTGVKDLLWVWIAGVTDTTDPTITGYTQRIKRTYTYSGWTFVLWGYSKLAEAADAGGSVIATFGTSYPRIMSRDVYRGVYNITPVQSSTGTNNPTGGHTVGTRTPTYPSSYFIAGITSYQYITKPGIRQDIYSVQCTNDITMQYTCESDGIASGGYGGPWEYIILASCASSQATVPVVNVVHTITASCPGFGTDAFVVLTPDPAGPTVLDTASSTDSADSGTKVVFDIGVASDSTNFTKTAYDFILSDDRVGTPYKEVLAFEYPTISESPESKFFIQVLDIGNGSEVKEQDIIVPATETGGGNDEVSVDYGFSSVIVRFSGSSATIKFTGYKEEVQ